MPVEGAACGTGRSSGINGKSGATPTPKKKYFNFYAHLKTPKMWHTVKKRKAHQVLHIGNQCFFSGDVSLFDRPHRMLFHL